MHPTDTAAGYGQRGLGHARGYPIAIAGKSDTNARIPQQAPWDMANVVWDTAGVVWDTALGLSDA